MRLKNIFLIPVLVVIFITSCPIENGINCTVTYSITNNSANSIDKLIYLDSNGNLVTLNNVDIPWSFTFNKNANRIVGSCEGWIYSTNNVSGNSLLLTINISGDKNNFLEKTITANQNLDLHFSESIEVLSTLTRM